MNRWITHPEDLEAQAALAEWRQAEVQFWHSDPEYAEAFAYRALGAREAFRARLAAARAVRGLPVQRDFQLQWPS